MKVKILGTEYEIILNAKEEKYPQLKGLNGYTDFTIKKIVIREFEKDDDSVEDLEYCKRRTLRHEIIHAFFYESGLNCESIFARNEELIDWIAIQFEKMLGVFIEVGAINSIGIDINVYDRTSNNPINDSVNLPKVKKAKACVKLPEMKIPDISPVKNLSEAMVNVLKECDDKKYASLLAGGDG